MNNWWIVKRPDKNDLIVEQPLDLIKHGDVIQLVHGEFLLTNITFFFKKNMVFGHFFDN